MRSASLRVCSVDLRTILSIDVLSAVCTSNVRNNEINSSSTREAGDPCAGLISIRAKRQFEGHPQFRELGPLFAGVLLVGATERLIRRKN